MPNTKILYLECMKRDFREFMLNNPGYTRRLEDGKIQFTAKSAEDPPWLYVKASRWQNCNLWHRVIFDQIHKKKKVPIPCQSCWKVVIMPRNFEELMATWIMQLELNLPCKCGTEGDRKNTDRLYGGYWYNSSIDKGIECYKVVKKLLQNTSWQKQFAGTVIKADFGNSFLPSNQRGTLPNLILKRGCTEYEQNCGPSDTWNYDKDQEEIEQYVNEAFSSEVFQPQQSENHVASILIGFIHKAFQWGDQSYQRFTNFNRLFNPPVTYHDKNEDFLKQVRGA